MAVTLPVLGLSSALKPLHSSRCSHRDTPTSCASNPLAFSSLCRVRSSQVSGSNRVSAYRALRGDETTSNSGVQSSESDVVSVYSGKSLEHCSGSGRSAEEALLLSPVLRRACRASALAVAASLMSAGASLADEVAASAVDASDVGISTTVSALFVAATVGLVVLTGGVIYLGLTEFLEKRALQEEQKKVAEAKPKKPTKQAVKAAARAGGPKGFGSVKRTGTKGDDEEDSI